MTEQKINELSEKYSRWTKTGYNGRKYDRIYFNAEDLGLEVRKYKTGNVAEAYVNGEKISNSEARRILNSKAYYDIVEGKLHMDSKMDEYFGEQIKAIVA